MSLTKFLIYLPIVLMGSIVLLLVISVLIGIIVSEIKFIAAKRKFKDKLKD